MPLFLLIVQLFMFLLLSKVLHHALNKLMLRLLPWHPGGCGSRATEDIKVEDLTLMVETLLEETATGDKVVFTAVTVAFIGSVSKRQYSVLYAFCQNFMFCNISIV